MEMCNSVFSPGRFCFVSVVDIEQQEESLMLR